MQALRDKHKRQETAIKEDIRLYGEAEAARRREQMPTLAWHEYCKSLMGGEPFSYINELMVESDDKLLARLAIKIINTTLQVATENKLLKEEIRQLKNENEIRIHQDKLQTVKLLNSLEP